LNHLLFTKQLFLELVSITFREPIGKKMLQSSTDLSQVEKNSMGSRNWFSLVKFLYLI